MNLERFAEMGEILLRNHGVSAWPSQPMQAYEGEQIRQFVAFDFFNRNLCRRMKGNGKELS